MRPVIYYVRHGQTDWNAQGRLQGGKDVPINALGEQQALRAGHILADLLARDGQDVQTLSFVSSPLGRARTTMELLRGTLRLPSEGYAIDDRLREISFGDMEGSMRESDPALFAARLANSWNDPPPNGESYAAVTARVTDWYDQVNTHTVAVAHGGTAWALMVALGIERPGSAVTVEQGAVYVFGPDGLAKYS